MNKDLRSRNEYFSTSSIGIYFEQYSRAIADALATVDHGEIGPAHAKIDDTLRQGGRVFVAGNGGSAAIADHLCCDFTKGIFSEKQPAIKTHSLVGSMALFSALANDVGYNNVFSEQLKMFDANGSDIVILISSSGNSPNILRAAEYCNHRDIVLIGLTGFRGGRLLEEADINLHVKSNNYGIIEDCHQILMHVIAQYHYKSHE